MKMHFKNSLSLLLALPAVSAQGSFEVVKQPALGSSITFVGLLLTLTALTFVFVLFACGMSKKSKQ